MKKYNIANQKDVILNFNENNLLISAINEAIINQLILTLWVEDENDCYYK